jgi:hypothetical protein
MSRLFRVFRSGRTRQRRRRDCHDLAALNITAAQARKGGALPLVRFAKTGIVHTELQ